MVRIALISLNFKTPFHIGWRSAEYVIESFTIHRSLIYASTLIEGNEERVDDVIGLKISSLLPIIFNGDCYKLLLPLPPLPSRINLKKLYLSWITLSAMNTILNNLSHGFPYTTDLVKDSRDGGKIIIAFNGVNKEFCFTGSVVHECSEKLSNVPSKIIEKIERYVNRSDRVVNAAEPFRVMGYMPLVEMGIIIHGSEHTVEYCIKLLKLLGEIGIGGLRSRGFGRFTAEEKQLCKKELALLDKHTGSKMIGYLTLLGSYKFDEEQIDFDKSIINKKTIGGYSGPPYDTYTLPFISIIGAGSIIYAKGEIKPLYLNLRNTLTNAVLVFNPVIMGV